VQPGMNDKSTGKMNHKRLSTLYVMECFVNYIYHNDKSCMILYHSISIIYITMIKAEWFYIMQQSQTKNSFIQKKYIK
jgi:hypothetical protein